MEGNNLDKQIVFLTDEDALKFMKFLEHYETFSLLLEKGVFEQKNAAISLHFDNMGTLRTIQRADFLYSRRFED